MKKKKLLISFLIICLTILLMPKNSIVDFIKGIVIGILILKYFSVGKKI
jgi:hypothetical protein